MKFPGLRRFLFAVAATGALLAGCGGGTVVGQLQPTRLVAFGDAFSDVGQAGGKYTVNDGSVNTWLEQVATRYGLPLTAQAAGGQGYARGNARITAKPDAAGGNVLTVKEQIDAFLAANTPGAGDLFFVGGGFSDVIVQSLASGLTGDQRVANIRQAAVDQGAQVRRLLAAGARQIVLTGVYDLGKTPWSTTLGDAGKAQVSTLSGEYNATLKVALVDLGSSVLYIDAANQFNLYANQPGSFGFNDGTTIACTSTGSGATGIGISSGSHVSSRTCTTSSIAAGVDYNLTLFADSVYTTPKAQRLFGDTAFDTIRGRF